MPTSINYDPIFELISLPRIRSYQVLLSSDEQSPYHQYGAYIWSQQASSSLYPLLQQLEILLRNAIDKEARKRFGEYWWKEERTTMLVDKTRTNWGNFINGMNIAERNLQTNWKKSERKRLGLASDAQLPETSVVPNFSHDDIIAATDFGTWKEVMINAYHASSVDHRDNYLWPKSMSKVFRRYSEFSNNADTAREEILNAINELKDYRNRLFHHDCIWVKSQSNDKQSAINSIRHKINLIEKLIKAISPVTYNSLKAWNVFSNAKRICSVEELNIYLTSDFENKRVPVSDTLIEHLKPSIERNLTVPMAVDDHLLCVYKLR